MPVTQRIYGALRSGIRDGRLPSGSRLDEGNLGRMLSAPRDAVRAALQRLRDDHLVERAPRRGTVVMRGPSRVDVGQLFHVRNLDSTTVVLEITTCPTPPGLFDAGPLATEAVVVERLLGHGDSLCFEITFSRAIDSGLHARLSAMYSQDRQRWQASQPLGEYFTEAYGAALGSVAITAEVVESDRQLATLIHIDAGKPVFRFERRLSDSAGTLVEVSHAYFPASANFLEFTEVAQRVS
ncbi:GntR family transcriptional regulator [Streptomyces malaysiensis]|uniref:GntR family transcriptional regulator n=1 Tax=Streptomyces malaysiensis TaxID=92644 RepID=UPI0009A024C5|nr:GntR family transcriptional regulator [Streptomyces sp. SPMA113]